VNSPRCSPDANALTFLGRPLGRLTAPAGAAGAWGGAGSVEVDAGSSVVRASSEPPNGDILAAKASSTRLASSADRRFLAFRMAMARSCSSSPASVSISRMSCARIAADSSVPSFSRTGWVVPFPVRYWPGRRGEGARPGSRAMPVAIALCSSAGSLVTSGYPSAEGRLVR
jgi:hypothetical protein